MKLYLSIWGFVGAILLVNPAIALAQDKSNYKGNSGIALTQISSVANINLIGMR